MIAAWHFEFMRNALASGLLASIVCGIIGTYVVVNRLAFLSGGIAHAAYGGIGISFFFGLPYVVGTLGFTLGVSLVIASVTLHARHRADTIVGVLWALGMAVGVILIDLAPGYNVDLMTYLFGSILTVPMGDLEIMLVLTIVIVAIVMFFFNDLLAMSYDEEFARVRGVPVGCLHYLLLAMIALSVVMIIRVVGLILVIAMLTIPPYIAERYVKSIGAMMILSVALNVLFTVVGLWLSYSFDLSSGASIILVAGCGFFLSLLLHTLLSRRGHPLPGRVNGTQPE